VVCEWIGRLGRRIRSDPEEKKLLDYSFSS
jgi:hypothetical protein